MSSLPQEKVCIHRYLTTCRTNPQPPGFADFLRGTIALHQYSKKYGYRLLVDAMTHPIFRYFEKCEYYLYEYINGHVNEFIPPMSYYQIDQYLNNMFSSGGSGIVLTNSFYRRCPSDQEITNFHGGLNDQETKDFMRTILTPNAMTIDKIEDVFDTEYHIDRNTKYNVIHIRTGDANIHDSTRMDYDIYDSYMEKINKILEADPERKYILITDSKEMGKEWKKNIPRILYWDNNKNHMGDLKNGGPQNVEDTMIDFFVIKGSQKIYSNGSGFSHCISTIYDIPYEII